MQYALDAASDFIGATAPNPPVGACAIDVHGNILAPAAHEQAGGFHAEKNLLRQLEEKRNLHLVHAIAVTLEPCNHFGRTGPCTQEIIKAGIKKVFIGALDPNLNSHSGAEFLKRNSVEVVSGILKEKCTHLIRQFAWKQTQNIPWVTVKQAINKTGSMIPPKGEKTFTSPNSLRFAHELRRRSDAIVSASGTVLADNPLFTVRHVPDFFHKRRFLCCFDRRGRISPDWKARQSQLGFVFPPHEAMQSFSELLKYLGNHNCLEVLVEAGPEFTNFVLESGLWNEHVVIKQSENDQEDTIITRSNNVYGNHR